VRRAADTFTVTLDIVDFGPGITPPPLVGETCVLDSGVATHQAADTTSRWNSFAVQSDGSGLIVLTFTSASDTPLGDHNVTLMEVGILCIGGDVFLRTSYPLPYAARVEAPVRVVST
jgi:hypothetical protein